MAIKDKTHGLVKERKPKRRRYMGMMKLIQGLGPVKQTRKGRTKQPQSGWGVHSSKRIVKFLGVCCDPKTQRTVLRRAPDSVYKSICNAFNNVANNPNIILDPKQQRLLLPHRQNITTLVDPKISLQRKKYLLQRGKGLWMSTIVPFAIQLALEYLGSKFIRNS